MAICWLGGAAGRTSAPGDFGAKGMHASAGIAKRMLTLTGKSITEHSMHCQKQHALPCVKGVLLTAICTINFHVPSVLQVMMRFDQ